MKNEAESVFLLIASAVLSAMVGTLVSTVGVIGLNGGVDAASMVVIEVVVMRVTMGVRVVDGGAGV